MRQKNKKYWDLNVNIITMKDNDMKVNNGEKFRGVETKSIPRSLNYLE